MHFPTNTTRSSHSTTRPSTSSHEPGSINETHEPSTDSWSWRTLAWKACCFFLPSRETNETSEQTSLLLDGLNQAYGSETLRRWTDEDLQRWKATLGKRPTQPLETWQRTGNPNYQRFHIQITEDTITFERHPVPSEMQTANPYVNLRPIAECFRGSIKGDYLSFELAADTCQDAYLKEHPNTVAFDIYKAKYSQRTFTFRDQEAMEASGVWQFHWRTTYGKGSGVSFEEFLKHIEERFRSPYYHVHPDQLWMYVNIAVFSFLAPPSGTTGIIGF